MTLTVVNSKPFAKTMESNKRLIQTDATPHNKASTRQSRHSTLLCSTPTRCVQRHVMNTPKTRSPIGTVVDHRKSNNNRIRKKSYSPTANLLFMFIVHVTVVNGFADPSPVRVSHSYTKTVINNNNASTAATTFRSSSITTPFLASDAIIPTSSSSSGSSSSTVVAASATTSDNNANQYESRAARKDFSTSIDRPFYTKITHDDAVHKPSYYSGYGKMPSKKGKKTKGSFSKYSKGSTERSMAMSEEDDYAFMPQTTEKSYHSPKLSLEPFFNFLTSLATASREVMSKEHQQQQQQQQPQPEQNSSNNNNNKYSPSYETLNQSMREGAKKSRKGKKGKGKKGGRGRKGSKKDKGAKRHRLKSEEEEEDEEQASDGPIPIPLPNPIIDSPENEESDDPADGAESPGGLHILDVLRTPMIPDYESPLTPPRVEALIGSSDYHEEASNKNASSSQSTNPPSGRANMNKGQGYLSFDQYDAQGTNSSSKGASNKGEKLRSDALDSFHDNVELQAQESSNHAQIMTSPYGIKPSGITPSQQYQPQPQHKNDIITASAHQTPVLVKAPQDYGKSESDDIFGKPSGKDDIVSKYPTTFVYRPHPSGPPPPPGSRPFLGQPPLGMPPKAFFGPPPSSRPSLFRFNKLRPNLHSYYDPSYHNYAAPGETLMSLGSDMFAIRQPYGPPHFRPPHHRPPMPPPRYNSGYGNPPGFTMSQRPFGSHYVGHTLTSSSSSSKEPITRPFGDDITNPSGTSDVFPQQDILTSTSGSSNTHASYTLHDISGGSEISPSESDNIDQFSGSEIDESPLTTGTTAPENSETKKVGIMESFDLFYKEYKILTWVVVFFATSLSFLSLLVYLYINNPPTEVVQAREFLFPWQNLLQNPQIINFLSRFVDTRLHRRSDHKPRSDYMKPYGNGFGVKSGKQKRKQIRTRQDIKRFRNRKNKINRRLNMLVQSQGKDASKP